MTGLTAALVYAPTGAMLGGVLVWRVVSARAAARHANLLAVAREQLAASTQSLKAAQADLEKERVAAQQRHMAYVAEQRSSVTRLEGQLRFAYLEIDRLNSMATQGDGLRADGVTDGDGFALTRPFER